MRYRTSISTLIVPTTLALAITVSIGCQENQQSMQWGGGNQNWFGGGTFTKNYDLQYPIGDTQMLNPAAAKPSPWEFKNIFAQNSYSRDYNLQYPVGKPEPVKSQPIARVSRPAPTPQVASIPRNSDAGATTHTKRFNLQYAIGSTQGVNGHRVASTAPTNSYSRHYDLQYPIGATQPVRRNSGNWNSSRATSALRYDNNNRSSGRVQKMTGSSSSGGSYAASSGNSYTVRPGDTMMSIARRQYGPSQAGRWQDIMSANRNQIQRPDEIRPGMNLRIP
jgi:nucleoid-associated protein YgaU